MYQTIPTHDTLKYRTIPSDLNRRSGACLSAQARQRKTRVPRSIPRRRASKRRRLGTSPSPGVKRFGRAPELIQRPRAWFGRLDYIVDSVAAIVSLCHRHYNRWSSSPSLSLTAVTVAPLAFGQVSSSPRFYC
ncbi:hypothetical protein B296_00051291 [Ensete ventricosum]|uniref:Uncharacterized protein n=1 Tax=Ensete ventricosum TaxID=4639 RepID=A0A426YCD5_ENSVE|nr:hypothetical protein B296_00051291 [Ensete ventricosum]